MQGRAFELSVGDALALEPFRQRLAEAGYASVSQVVSPGEFAVRGSLLDVYPMGTTAPLRIDLFDDEIEAIRTFDPESQRSLDSLENIRLLPAREVPLDPDAIKEFRRRFRTRFEGDPTKTTIYRGVSEGIAPAGIEFYLPLFFEGTATLFDYLPPNAVIVHDAALAGGADQDVGGYRGALRGSPPRYRAADPAAGRAVSRAGGARCQARHVLLHHARGLQGGHRVAADCGRSVGERA